MLDAIGALVVAGERVFADVLLDPVELPAELEGLCHRLGLDLPGTLEVAPSMTPTGCR